LTATILGCVKSLLDQFGLAVKEEQIHIRDYVAFIFLPYFCNFQIAFFTQNCTVVGYGSTPNFSRHYCDRVATNRIKLLSTLSTHDPIKPLLIEESLPFPSAGDNSPIEIHTSPPRVTWARGETGHDWFGHTNGEWNGLHVYKVSRLWVSVKNFIKLKRPSYEICFCPNGDTHNVLPLVDMPTLREAQELAEQYYTIWLNVNHNR